MATVSEILQERLQSALQTIEISSDEVPQLSPTAEPRYGDYQSNAAMVLGKKSAKIREPLPLALWKLCRLIVLEFPQKSPVQGL